MDNEPQYVNLGLPSGKLWTTSNLGAEESNDVGDYYRFGETESVSNVPYKFTLANGEYSKYHKDGRRHLEYEDDAVTKKYGLRWHIPTILDFFELKQTCELKAFPNGVLFISRVNGNQLFLPSDGNPKTIRYATAGVENDENLIRVFMFGGEVSYEYGVGKLPRDSTFLVRGVGYPEKVEHQPYMGHEYVDMGYGFMVAEKDFLSDSTLSAGPLFWINDKGQLCQLINSESQCNVKYKKKGKESVILLEEDIIRQNWKGEWRIPTQREFAFILSICHIEFIWLDEKQSKCAYKLTSTVTGNVIYLHIDMGQNSSEDCSCFQIKYGTSTLCGDKWHTTITNCSGRSSEEILVLGLRYKFDACHLRPIFRKQ